MTKSYTRIFFRKMQKSKNWSHSIQKSTVFHRFQRSWPKNEVFSVLWLQFSAFFCTFINNEPEYINPSGHFIFYEIFLARTFFYLWHCAIKKRTFFAASLHPCIFSYFIWWGNIRDVFRFSHRGGFFLFFLSAKGTEGGGSQKVDFFYWRLTVNGLKRAKH